MIETRKIEANIRGLHVTRAYQSVTGMIHFDLSGYSLMVETATWRMSRLGATLVSDASSRARIDLALYRLVRRRLIRARFAADLSTLDFEIGLRLILFPSSARYNNLDNWTLFRGGEPILALSNRRRLDTFAIRSSS